jgi:hypothetical protein
VSSSPAAPSAGVPESSDVGATLHRIEAVLERIADRLDRDEV